MPRILALCLGLFGLVNALAGFIRPELDANIWWIDPCGIPATPARILLALICATLIAYALAPEMQPWRRSASLASVGTLLFVCLLNCAIYFVLFYKGTIHSTLPVPLSAFIAAALVLVVRDLIQAQPLTQNPNWVPVLAALVLCLIGFPLAQIFLFGKTNYARPADAAIVFGARAYADGTASTALADRVRTACTLHRNGMVKKLIFSGGPGDGTFHETDVMRSLALQWGVPDTDIILDREGLNTRATLLNSKSILAEFNAPRILAISHFYHLPRIKLESQRLGLDLRTVPAHESYTLTKMPLLIGREVAALWFYYLNPPTIT